MAIDSEDILNKTNEIISKEGELNSNSDLSPAERLEKFIIPGLNNSKGTLASLYKFVPKEKSGIMGKFKNRIIGKVKNIVLNVVERESMQQQKFNELTFQAIQELQKEIDELKK